MGEILKKPYEISIWDDELVTLTNNQSYYKERKIAIIGTDTMAAKTSVFDPILTLNINGEKTLSFSLQYRYFDETEGDFVNNDFVKLLVNERKVKLHYNNQWYDFIIKERTESSENYIYNYTAIDIFTNELARQGYSITLDNELNNNQGTAIELAESVLKDTDWIVDKDDSDLLQQYVAEPLYKCVTTASFEVLNTNTNEMVSIDSGETIYLFSSYVTNKTKEFVQFLRYNDFLTWHIDDHNIIKGINYRILEEVDYNTTSNIITGSTVRIQIQEPYFANQGYRLVYQQKSLYDSAMEEYVDVYRANFYGESQDIYHFQSYEYGASALIQNYVTNGTQFKINDSGAIEGWDGMVNTTTNTLPSLQFTNSVGSAAPSTNQITGLKSFLKVKFPAAISGYANGIHNSGLYDTGSMIDGIACGEEYVLRLRYGVGNDNGPTNVANGAIKAVVAFYTVTPKIIDGKSYSLKTFKASDVIFDFDIINTEANNKITNGQFNSTYTIYYVDNIPQTPSLDYCYYDITDNSKQAYIWDADNSKYIVKNNSKFYVYRAGKASARKTVSAADLKSKTKQIGIFLYAKNNADKTYYFQSVEFFKYVESGNNEFCILPNNAPEAYVNTIEHFYWKPYGEYSKDELSTYRDLAGLAADYGIQVSDIVKVYDENCEKVLSISEKQSNCYNILQSICETFECWLKISVEHESNGAVKLDSSYRPIKKIAFKEYVGKDNYSGFKYGINLNSIERSIDSNEFVSKLIVEDLSSDYTPDGTLSISYADANPSGESVIYDFSHYINNGLIDNIEGYKQDQNNLNTQLHLLNQQYRSISTEVVQLSLAYEKAQAVYGTALATLEEAQRSLAARQEAFKAVTGLNLDYEGFITKYGVDDRRLQSPEIATIVGGILSDNSTLNSIGGIVTTSAAEYKDLSLTLDGAKEYSVTISTSNYNGTWKTKITMSDYFPGVSFLLSGPNVPSYTFISTLQEKEVELETAEAFYTISISGLPKDSNRKDIYKAQYTKDNQVYELIKNSKLHIINTSTLTGITRRLKLVPDADYAAKYKGKNRELEEIIEQKQAIISEFENKYARFIQEGTWTSDNYIDSNLYYFDALQISQVSAKPKVSYTFNVTEISEIENYENYNFDIGDKTYVEDVEFFGYKPIEAIKTPHQEEVIISQIEWHLDTPEENIVTVQNYKTRFEDLFQRMNAAIVAAEFNENAYARAAGAVQADGTLDPRILAMSLNNIGNATYSMGSAGNIKTTEDGFEFKSQSEASKMLRITSRGIAISDNGGNLWTDVLTADGINTQALKAGSIDTSLITISDSNNTAFRWDMKGLSAYGYDDDGGYDLDTFVRFDKYGLYGIKKGGEYVVTDLEDIQDKAYFGVTWDGFFIRNKYPGGGRVEITSENDFRVLTSIPTRGNTIEKEKIKIGALEWGTDEYGNPITDRQAEGATTEPTLYGIRITNNDDQVVMQTGDDGNLTITGTIHATDGEFAGTVYATDGEFTGTIHATDGEFAGHLESNSGKIGGFSINNTSLYNGEIGINNAVYMSTGYVSDTQIGLSNGENEWAFTAGNKFGVTTDGKLYATDVVLQGDIQANNGSFRGYVEAESGRFNGNIIVGSSVRKYITINAEGLEPIIASSDYIHNSSAGWVINGNGDATFNNVSVRGSIKTAVFEYSEIQAVGGAFLFRPSSTIKTARIDGDNVIVSVEQPSLFKVNEWVKLSSYKGDASSAEDDGGLTTVYKIGSISNNEITLLGAGVIFNSPEDKQDEDIVQSDGDAHEYITPAEEGSVSQFEPNTYEVVWEENLLENRQYYINHNYQQYIKDTAKDIVRFYSIDGSVEIVYFYSYEIETEEEGETVILHLVDTVHKEGNRYYYLDEQGEKCYHIYGDSSTLLTEEYLVKDEQGELLTQELVDETEIVTDREVIYIGNLALFDISLYNTGENFLIMTYEEDNEIITRVISSIELEIFKLEVYEEVKNNIADVVGGALISFGYAENTYSPFVPLSDANPKEMGLYVYVNNEYVLTTDETVVAGTTYYKEKYENGIHNYGIGINSSDNYVGLPARAISLFESQIHPEDSIKVTYDWKGILGTLPPLGSNYANTSIYRNMEGTQGIYTNNMYIGDNNQFIAFYEDEHGDKQLRIKANQVVYEVIDPNTHQPTGQWNDINDIEAEGVPGPPGKDGEDAISTTIDSSAGNVFINGVISTVLRCYVYKGGVDITNDNNYNKTYTWTKINISDGSIIQDWTPTAVPLEPNAIRITVDDVTHKAVFQCSVDVEEV